MTKTVPMIGATTMIFVAAVAVTAASTGSPFYGDPPDTSHPWAVHDQNRPQPAIVSPGTFSSKEQPGMPPADAIVLFDGTSGSLSKWETDKNGGGQTKWTVKNGALECTPSSGYIRTKDQFADCQLHVEWAAPTPIKGESQGRGNSGIFLMGTCEVQVLDNYDNPTYADGFAGSVYGINPPLVNPLRPPGEFQVVDIVFRRPIYKDGKPLDPGYVTVFINGVLVQDHTPLEGPGGHMRRSKAGPFPERGPLKLQDHGNPVRYRNIWYRPLPPRAVEGGTDGALSSEAAMAKREKIAASIRNDAAKLKGDQPEEMLRFAESLVYANDEPAVQKVEQLATAYIESLKSLPAGSIGGKKDEAKTVAKAFQYLLKFNIMPSIAGPKAELEKFIKAKGW